MKTIRSCSVALFLLVSLAPTASAQRVFTSQYSFGDSLSDSGNLYALTGRTQPPSPPYVNGRFSNGPTFVELLGNPILPSATISAKRGNLNFAFAGATAAAGSPVPSLPVQFGMFVNQGLPATSNDLFTVLAGANDLIATLSSPATPANPSLLDAAGINAADAVATFVNSLTGVGAKNILVAGMPNLGATPRSLAAGGPGGAGATFGLRASTAFNTQLMSRLRTAAAATSDVNFTYFDFQAVVDRIIADYRALGYANATSYYLAPAAAGGGVGDPNSYVFFDDLHPTGKTHALLAAIVTEELNPEGVLAFNAAVGSASFELQRLTTAALDDRTTLLLSSTRPAGRADAYVAFNYGDGERSGDLRQRSYDYTAQVVTTGVDVLFGDGFFVGGAMNIGRLNSDVGGGGNFTAEDTAGRVYGIWRGGPVSLTLDGDYGTVTVKGIHRTTAFGGFQTNGKTGGEHWGAGLKLAWTFDSSRGFTLRNWVGLRTHRLRLGAYTEKDVPSLNMDYNGQQVIGSTATYGIDFTKETKLGGRAARFDFRGAWRANLGARGRDVAGRLANNVTRLTAINVSDGEGSGLTLGLAGTLFLTKSWSTSLGFAGDKRSGEDFATRASLSLQTGF